MINVSFVKEWSAKYPVWYDEKYYDPYIKAARSGDANALRRLTEWKNVGKGPRPMRLSMLKEKAFQRFQNNLKEYLQPDGSRQLRTDFWSKAPIWSIFWHHALFGTPIFDVYTHMAYHWEITGTVLSKKDAEIHSPGHWPIFDRYSVWFEQKVKSLGALDGTLTDRDVDRALMCWGEDQTKKQRTARSTSISRPLRAS